MSKTETFIWRLTAQQRDHLLDHLTGEKISEANRTSLVAELGKLAHPTNGGSSNLIKSLTPNLSPRDQEAIEQLVADVVEGDEEVAMIAARRLEALKLVAEIGRDA